MNKKKVKISIIILAIVVSITFVFIMNTLFYYKTISRNNLLTHFIISYQILTSTIWLVFQQFYKAILAESILKVLIIGTIFVYIFEKTKGYIITNLSSFEFKDFKVHYNKTDEEKVKKSEVVKDVITNCENNDTTCKDIDGNQNFTNSNVGDNDKINGEKCIKSSIERLIIDCPFMASIIDEYINKKRKKISINLNIIPYKVTLTQISVIFEYKIKSNSIEIRNIKEDIEPIVIDVFKDFLERGIIYIENDVQA